MQNNANLRLLSCPLIAYNVASAYLNKQMSMQMLCCYDNKCQQNGVVRFKLSLIIIDDDYRLGYQSVLRRDSLNNQRNKNNLTTMYYILSTDTVNRNRLIIITPNK